ncbi:SIS domain-containing protein [soil metagenome]
MTNPTFSVSKYLEAHQRLVHEIDLASFQRGIELIRATFFSGHKVVTCGNGGSASTASHYITDWTKSGSFATGRRLHGISLVDSISLVTAFANDLSYDEVFAGQVRSIVDEGDLLIAVSGSGNSPNVLKAVRAAHELGADTLAVVGYDGGELMRIARHAVWVPSFDMQLCEDMHLMFGHMVMKSLCGSPITSSA